MSVFLHVGGKSYVPVGKRDKDLYDNLLKAIDTHVPALSPTKWPALELEFSDGTLVHPDALLQSAEEDKGSTNSVIAVHMSLRRDATSGPPLVPPSKFYLTAKQASTGAINLLVACCAPDSRDSAAHSRQETEQLQTLASLTLQSTATLPIPVRVSSTSATSALVTRAAPTGAAIPPAQAIPAQTMSPPSSSPFPSPAPSLPPEAQTKSLPPPAVQTAPVPSSPGVAPPTAPAEEGDAVTSALESSVDVGALAKMDHAAVSQFGRQLQRRGYAVVRLTGEQYSQINTFHKLVDREYFQALSGEEKARLPLMGDLRGAKVSHQYGYFARADMGKELFQVRECDEKCPWPTTPKAFRQAALQMFQFMKGIGVTCLKAVGRYLNVADSHANDWDALCDGGSPATDNPLCSTLLDVFRYHAFPADKFETCGAHTDYGLLTLIPAPSGSAALQVYDWLRGEYRHVEAEYETARDMVIMAGESLQFLSGKSIYASIHQVLNTKLAKPARVSTPFLLFANPSKPLNLAWTSPSSQQTSTSKTVAATRLAGDFVLEIVSKTPSVTFDHMYNAP